jgi:hypothetical protein
MRRGWWHYLVVSWQVPAPSGVTDACIWTLSGDNKLCQSDAHLYIHTRSSSNTHKRTHADTHTHTHTQTNTHTHTHTQTNTHTHTHTQNSTHLHNKCIWLSIILIICWTNIPNNTRNASVSLWPTIPSRSGGRGNSKGGRWEGEVCWEK